VTVRAGHHRGDAEAPGAEIVDGGDGGCLSV
jgi:hypothetical protein